MAPNRWTSFVKVWAAKNKVSYMCALTEPKLKKEYNIFYPPAARKEMRNAANRQRRAQKKAALLPQELVSEDIEPEEMTMEEYKRALRLPDTTQLDRDIAKIRYKDAKRKSKNIKIPDFGEMPTAAELRAQFAPKKAKKTKTTPPTDTGETAIQADLLKKALKQFYIQTKLQSPNLDNLNFEKLNNLAAELTQDDTDYLIKFNTIMLRTVVKEYTTPNIPKQKKDFLELLKNRVKAVLQKNKEDAGRPQAGDEYEQSGVEIDNSPAGKKENKHIKLIEGKMKTALNYTSDDFSNYLKKIEEMTNKYGVDMINPIKLSILNKISISEAIQILDKLRGDNKYMTIAKEKKIKLPKIKNKSSSEKLLLTLSGGALIGRQANSEGGCMMCGGALIGRQPYVEGGKLTGKKFVKGLKRVGKETASALLHYGLPATLGVAGEMVGGPAGAAFGAMTGDMIADRVGEKTGYGLKKIGRPMKMDIDYLSTSRGSFI